MFRTFMKYLRDKCFNHLSHLLYKLGGAKMIKTNDFPRAKTKMKRLIPVVNEYDFEDISKAIYCICVCVNNRSVLESTLSLNWALTEHKHQGNKKIENYEDFKKFFTSIESIIKSSVYDDAVVEDYGDVSIEVFGKKYSVIVGTGHNMVFACLQFLPILACEVKKGNELIEVMTYNSFIIDCLKDVNTSDGDYGARLVLPTKNLFYKVIELFNNLDTEIVKNVASILKTDYIEKKHFIETESGIIPLANTSLLMDLYDVWYKSVAEKDKAQLINRMLTGVALNLSKLETDETINYLCPVEFSDSRENPKPIYQFPFALVSSKGIIFAVNKNEYSNAKLQKVVDEMIRAKKNDSLFLLELYSRNRDGKCRGITVLKDSDIKFMVYDAWANPSETHIIRHTENEEYHYCTALDIVYYLLFMKDADELNDYFDFIKDENEAQIIGHGGDASTFLMWKDADHVFEKGAIKYGMINVGFDTENEYVVDYYRKNLQDFPFESDDYILDNPFSWNITPKENKFYEYVQKGKTGFGGLYRLFRNNCYFFFPHNVKFYPDINEYLKYKDAIFMIEDMIQRMMISVKDIIESCSELDGCTVQVMMMPETYARKSDPSGMLLAQERNYVKSDSIISNRKICIRFVPIINKIFEDIANAKDRTVEVEFFMELLQPLKKYFPNFYLQLEKHMKGVKTEKKEVSAISFSIEYTWKQEQESIFRVEDGAYIAVRKHIAEVCFNAGISSGSYYGIDATAVVRSIQKELIEDFENEVIKYDYLKLFERSLADYSTLLHEIMIHMQRYNSFEDMKGVVRAEVSQNIIGQREEAKHNLRTVSYLLETALYNSGRGQAILSSEKYQYLLAYSNWLVVLGDNADMCYFTEDEVYVEVTGEYIIDVASKRESGHLLGEELAIRMYDNPGHFERDNSADEQFFEKAKQAFETDTDVPLEVFLTLMYYLETGGKIGSKLYHRGNAFCFWKEDIIDDYCSVQNVSKVLTEKALQLLCINAARLKTKNNVDDFYLPIGEKEKRCDRYEVKPVYEYDDMVIYSPSAIHFLRDYWQNSMFEFHMPYEIGLPATKKVLIDWKKVYEKKIVFDLEKVFEGNGFKVRPNFELMNLDKKKYPQYLGDYDLFAVDLQANEIWIVECKFIEKVETFYEMYRQQKRFFREDKCDEKFQRRIDFLNKNYAEVIKDLKLPTAEYKIKPYMCVNKVFVSRYKEIAFPILSYQEMVEKIVNGKHCPLISIDYSEKQKFCGSEK